MSRTTALLLALALLLAHAFALYHTAAGELAAPMERAHVAWRLARNLVHEGTLAWNPGDGRIVESHPSPLWVGILSLTTRLYIGPNLVAQAIGLVSALATVVLVAGFSPVRLSGIIAPALLVVNGSLATAALGGTELPLFTALVAGAFLAYERGSRRGCSVLLALTVLARPEGIVVVALLFLFELARRLRGSEHAKQRQMLRAMLPAIVAWIAVGVLRRSWTGTFLSPTTRGLLEPAPGQLDLGLQYVVENVVLMGGPLLAVAPLLLLVTRHLSGQGRRALALGVVLVALVALGGGDGLPFGQALLPALPVLFIAVQEALRIAMDSRRKGLEPVAWLAFLVGIVASVLFSKLPSNIGPLEIEPILRERMRAGDLVTEAWGRPHGRLGLRAEIQETQRLRRLSIFLRDRLDPGVSILTPWPGTIGYLSRKQVHDLLQRASAPPDGGPNHSWSGARRVDVAASLRAEPDYIVPIIDELDRPPRLIELAQLWMERYDTLRDHEDGVDRYREVLSGYELISVPIPTREQVWDASNSTFYLLRRKAMQLGPVLELDVDETRFEVLAKHRGHQQIVNLELRIQDASGDWWWMQPRGTFVRGEPTHVRTGVLMYETFGNSVAIVRGRLPEGTVARRLEAVLRNPGAPNDETFSEVSARLQHTFR